MTTRQKAQENLTAAKTRLSNKQREISRLKRESIFKGVTIQDQFSVGRSSIKSFSRRKKAERVFALKQLGLSKSELPMLRDELNLRKTELDFLNSPSLGEML